MDTAIPTRTTELPKSSTKSGAHSSVAPQPIKTLAGKVAIVTGGSRGIGAASARELARLGADVAISYSASVDRATALVAELKEAGVRAAAFRADQADPAQITRLISDVVATFGGFDILVANAAVFVVGEVKSTGNAALDEMHAINVGGTIASIRAAAGVIHDDGRIIVMSSGIAYRVGAPGMADYASTKAALEGYVRGAAHDLAPRRITINALGIGAVDTEMNPDGGPFSEWLKSVTALKRYAQPEEIAAVVGFVASPAASYMTGGVLPVSGGGVA
jgi:3-oxoacyl-[acyl-carrier protein] reductase